MALVNKQGLVFVETPNHKAFKNLHGVRFGKLVVIGFAGMPNRTSYWFCDCDCGATAIIRTTRLVSGNAKSCGCSTIRKDSGLSIKHGHARKGMVTRTWYTWKSMRNRCYNKKSQDYEYYGGRGIKVCCHWLNSFENFLKDMGEKPKGYTIERIENNGDYEPENCRWAKRKEQANNTRKNVFLTLNGITMTVAQWSEQVGIRAQTISYRIKSGWTVKDALSIPAICYRN